MMNIQNKKVTYRLHLPGDLAARVRQVLGPTISADGVIVETVYPSSKGKARKNQQVLLRPLTSYFVDQEVLRMVRQQRNQKFGQGRKCF